MEPSDTDVTIQQITAAPAPAREPAVDPGRRPFSLVGRQGPWKHALLRRMLAAADVLAILFGCVAAGNVSGGIALTIAAAATLPLWILIAKFHGLYDHDHTRIRHLTSDELPNLFYWVTLSVVATSLILNLTPIEFSVTPAVVIWTEVLLMSFLLRIAARGIWRRVVPAERGLVIGEGPLADSVARKLSLEHGHHLELVASLPIESRLDRPSEGALALGDLGALLEDRDIERVVLAASDLDERTLSTVVSTCREHAVRLSVAPPLRAMLGTAVRLNHLAELPLIEFKTWDPSRSTALLKRAFDAAFASLALLVCLPLFALLALVVRIDSPGPAFFRQQRSGQGGRPFMIIKFRTMVRDAEDRLSEVVRLDELADPMFKLRSDPRVTRVGRVLRRWSLDELPQLINVVRGEMSIVGPRPEETRLVERYDPGLSFRNEMRPGITGPMQVHGRGELNFQERVAVEREYVENHSLRRDFKLLVRTVSAIFRKHGAY